MSKQLQSNSDDISYWYDTSFEQFSTGLNGASKLPIHGLRQSAYNVLSKQGLPNTKVEEWKYTSTASLQKIPFHLYGTDETQSVPEGALSAYDCIEDAYRVVLIGGLFDTSLASLAGLPDGMRIASIEQASKPGAALHELVTKSLGSLAAFGEKAQGCVALNTAFVRDGVVIDIDANVMVERPIHILHVAPAFEAATACFPRVLLRVGEESSVTIIEQFVGIGGESCFVNAVTEIDVAAQAQVEHYKIQIEGGETAHVGSLHVKQGNESRFSTGIFNFGGKLVRNEVHTELDGEEIFSQMYGLNALQGSQHVDNCTVLDHAKPNCESDELFKGIYADSSRGIFSGTIIVRPDAQKTNAIQNNSSLLLSDTASSDSRPQLKIWADDVKCTHGATVGQLDEEALHYIRSRGIDKKTAYAILIRAYCGEVLANIECDEVRDYVDTLLNQQLERIQ